LCLRFGRGRGLRGQLKHCCHLTLAQKRQQLDPPVGKFERIVMGSRFACVNLSEDCCPMSSCIPAPPKQAMRKNGDLFSER
jgi:hypothetical protein